MGDVDPDENPLDGELEADLPEEFKRVKPSKIVSGVLKEHQQCVRKKQWNRARLVSSQRASRPLRPTRHYGDFVAAIAAITIVPTIGPTALKQQGPVSSKGPVLRDPDLITFGVQHILQIVAIDQ